MIGKGLRAFLAVTVGLVGLAALPSNAPVQAQGVSMVTRTLDSGVEVQVREGKFFTVVGVKTGTHQAHVHEGDVVELAVVSGAEIEDPANPPQFTCNTIAGTASPDQDYVGGYFPLSLTTTVVTLPLVAKAELNPDDASTSNVYDPSENLLFECWPNNGHLWQVWSSPRVNVTILDQVEPADPPSGATITRMISNPSFSHDVPAGKFYTLGFDNDGDFIVDREGFIGEGNLGEFVVALGEIPAAGDLGFSCRVIFGTADANDLVGGIFPMNSQAVMGEHQTLDMGSTSVWALDSDGKGGGATLPIVSKQDAVQEYDNEWVDIECMPVAGSEAFDWRAWPSPRTRLWIVDGTTEVRFPSARITIEEGSSDGVTLLADSKADRAGLGPETGFKIGVVATFGRDQLFHHPSRFRFSGTQATSVTHTITTASGPQALPIEAVDNGVCQTPFVFSVSVSPPSPTSWATASGIVGVPEVAFVRVVDDGDPPAPPNAVAAALNGTTLRANWRPPRCPDLDGVELEYKRIDATDWTNGLKAGPGWDYDGDGDPSNNRALTTSHTVTGLESGHTYNVRVRYHNDGGAGGWKETYSGNAIIYSGSGSSVSSGGGTGTPPATGGGGFVAPPPAAVPEDGDDETVEDGEPGGDGQEPAPDTRPTILPRDADCESDAELDNFPFDDVSETSYARSDIGCLLALAVTTGTSATTYSPGQEVSRAQMASFLARLYTSVTGEQAPVAQTPFTDVVAGSTHAADIARLYGLGITTGAGATAYFPDQIVDREQMASFIAKFYEVVTGAPAPVVDTPFTDLPADSLAADDIARIWGLGITTGATPSTLAPAENVTREQMASFLSRLYRVLTESGAGGE